HHRVLVRLDEPNINDVAEPVGGQLGSADAPYQDVQLIGSPSVRSAASELYATLIVLDSLTRFRPMDPAMIELTEQNRNELMGKSIEFRRAIQVDLGVEPDTPEQIAEWLGGRSEGL